MQVRTIVTDQTFVDRSQRLEEALKSNDCKAYCEEKMANSATEQEKAEWSLLSVLFESVPLPASFSTHRADDRSLNVPPLPIERAHTAAGAPGLRA
jgi:hypothetical protein